MGRWVAWGTALLFAWGSAVPHAWAMMGSPNYRLDADVLNYGGGASNSPSYATFDSLGDFTSGLSRSANYILNSGPAGQMNTTITLALDGNKSLGTLTPGTPVMVTSIVSVTTDAANGYSLAANYSAVMKSGSNSIPDWVGTIAVPAPWSGNCPDFGQCGFGFTVSSGTDVESKWGGGANYAAFTTAATEIHRKTGFSSPADETRVRYRADVSNTQASGAYATTVTYTVTATL